MSHTRSSAGDAAAPGARTFDELTRMVNQGRSWSGRERNCVFLNTTGLNTAGTKFANVSAATGLDFPDDGRAVAVTDWDQDGDLDLWISNRNAPRLRFLQNGAAGGGGARFLALRLEGNGTTTSRDAIGARVELATGAGAARSVRTLRAGEGFLAQSSKWMHFGLGDAPAIESVTVRWPGGEAETFRGLEAGRRYHLVQGSGRAREWTRPAKAVLAPSTPELPAPSERARIPVIMGVKVPRLEFEEFGGSRAPLPLQQGKHVLINFWASWCAPCLEELQAFARKEKELREAGVEVLALSVDGLGDDRSDPAAAREILVSRLRFPFRGGRASAGLVQMFQYLHDGLITLHRPLPVPVSFLVDPRGRLSVLYKGPVKVEELLADLGQSAGTRQERRRRAALLGGRTLEHEIVERALLTEEAKARFQYALDLEKAGLMEDARDELQEVLAARPDFVEARNNLGLVLLRIGALDEASAQLGEALRLRPDLPEARFNLGLLNERRGNSAAAAAEYQAVLRLRPGYPGAHNALGLLHAKAERIRAAQAEFAEEVRLQPDSAEARNHLGLALLNLGQTDAAMSELERAVELKPDLADAHNNLGVALKRLGRLDDAAARYREAARLQPGFAEAHNNLGLILLSQGKAGEAKTCFERALAAQPDFAPARRNLDRAAAQLKGTSTNR